MEKPMKTTRVLAAGLVLTVVAGGILLGAASAFGVTAETGNGTPVPSYTNDSAPSFADRARLAGPAMIVISIGEEGGILGARMDISPRDFRDQFRPFEYGLRRENIVIPVDGVDGARLLTVAVN
jgi:hypothetical protein